GGLRVEEAVGLLRLLEPEAVGEQTSEAHLAVGDELRALGLAHARERPRCVDRQLAPDQVLADVERRRVALADERHAAPGRGAAHRGHARVRVARAVHRRLDALAVRELADRGDRVRLLRVDDRLGAELARECQPLGGDVDRDHPGAHRAPEQRRAEPDRPWPKTASVSRPETSRRLSAPYAVPVPHEIAAPSSKVSDSGSGTSVDAGTVMNGACPPWPVMPYTTMPWRQSCAQPTRQCMQRPQP